MSTSIYATTIWGQHYAVRANWAEASSMIESLNADDEWDIIPTGQQVGDFRHRPAAALRQVIERDCMDGIDDETRSEIDAAMATADYES